MRHEHAQKEHGEKQYGRKRLARRAASALAGGRRGCSRRGGTCGRRRRRSRAGTAGRDGAGSIRQRGIASPVLAEDKGRAVQSHILRVRDARVGAGDGEFRGEARGAGALDAIGAVPRAGARLVAGQAAVAEDGAAARARTRQGHGEAQVAVAEHVGAIGGRHGCAAPTAELLPSRKQPAGGTDQRAQSAIISFAGGLFCMQSHECRVDVGISRLLV